MDCAVERVREVREGELGVQDLQWFWEEEQVFSAVLVEVMVK